MSLSERYNNLSHLNKNRISVGPFFLGCLAFVATIPVLVIQGAI